MRNWIRQIWSRVRTMVGKPLPRVEMDEEIRSHVEMQTRENVEAGMNPEEARYAALRQFGWVETIKQDCRDQRGGRWLDNLIQDLRFGIRQLRKSPGFTLVAVVMLALGIGINAGIFTILNAAAFRPLPLRDSSRLVSVFQHLDAGHAAVPRNVFGDSSRASFFEYRQYRDHSHGFSGLMAYAPSIGVTLGGDNPRRVSGALVSANYFDVLRTAPQLGRALADADCAVPGGGAVVVLSDAFWRGEFQSDPSIIGKAIRLNRTAYTVIGVAPKGFQGTEAAPAAFWAPLTMQKDLAPDADLLSDDHCGWLALMGRLRDGVSMRQVEAELGLVSSRIDQTQPGRKTILKIRTATLAGGPESRAMVLGVGSAVMLAVGLVLVIVCLNIASLILARGVRRRKEFAVRAALGAGRSRLARQMLAESLVLALMGGGLGCACAFWSSSIAVRFVQSHLPPDVPNFAMDVGPDLRVLAFAMLLTLVVALVFGLVPAFRAAGVSLTLAMKAGETGLETNQARSGFFQRGLISIQVAVCMVLLLVAGLLARGLNRSRNIDPGFDARNVAVVSFDLAGAGYDNRRAENFQRQLVERIASAQPGVEAVAQAAAAPLGDSHFGDLFYIPGREGSQPAEYNEVSPDYFPLLRIPIVRGRNFTESERKLGFPVAIVTESTARRFWPEGDPIGKIIRKGAARADAVNLEVVGVVRDAQVSHLAKTDPFVFLPASAAVQSRLQLLVRSADDGGAATAAIRALAKQFDPELAVSVARLESNFDRERFPGRILASLSGVLGALSLLLALIGVYGSVSHSAGQRVREIGIRMALGARRSEVTVIILRNAMIPVALGVVVGIAGCAATSSLLTGVLYGISPHDPVSFALVPALLLVVTLLACWLPARRAARVDPMVTLRQE